jgi:hypothetical protein
MPGQLSFLKIGNDFVRDPGVNVLILVRVARSLSKAALTQLWTSTAPVERVQASSRYVQYNKVSSFARCFYSLFLLARNYAAQAARVRFTCVAVARLHGATKVAPLPRGVSIL